MSSSNDTPVAGVNPALLAGRKEILERANNYLESIQKRYPQQSVVYYGLRGVGKTVLLNSIELAAKNKGILSHRVDAGEDGRFTSSLISAIGKIIDEISMKEAAREFTKNNVEDSAEDLGVQKKASFSYGIYADDLTEVFVAAGKSALRSNDSICFFIDDVHFLSPEEMNGLIAAVHRCNQLRLPVMIFCAGLPRIKKMMGDACPYSERLFKYEPIGIPSNKGAMFTSCMVEIKQRFDPGGSR